MSNDIHGVKKGGNGAGMAGILLMVAAVIGFLSSTKKPDCPEATNEAALDISTACHQQGYFKQEGFMYLCDPVGVVDKQENRDINTSYGK